MKIYYISNIQDKNLESLYAYLNEKKEIALDIETTGLSPQKDNLCSIQIAVGKTIWILHIIFLGKNVLDDVMKYINKPEKRWIIHNAKFELQFFYSLGYQIQAQIYDTMLAESCLMQGKSKGKVSLAYIVKKYCETTLDKGMQTSDWSRLMSRKQQTYAANDVLFLKEIKKLQKIHLEQEGLVKTVRLENKAVKATAFLEFSGITFDSVKAQILLKSYKKLVENSNQEFDSLGIKPNSPRKLKQALRERGIMVDSTDKKTLAQFVEYPLIEKILKYKRLEKKKQCVEKMLENMDESTFRIHAHYSQNFTSTGRYSCSEPNLQGIPHEEEIRELFTAPKNKMFVIGDYSQMELRIMAEVTEDPTMIEAYQKGMDLHIQTASIVNGKAYDKITSEERKQAKAMNFGLIYGMSTKTFISYAKCNYGVEIMPYEAEEMVSKFFMQYKNVDKRIDKMKWKTTDFEVSVGGRKRVWDNFPTANERTNYAIQATGADILKEALVMVEKKWLRTGKAKIVLSVHDEIVLEVDEKDAKMIAVELKKIMEKAGRKYLKTVPAIADISVGKNWAAK